jgi:hypothetical protein
MDYIAPRRAHTLSLAATLTWRLLSQVWNDYKAASDLLIAEFGKSRIVADLDTDDFAKLRNRMAKNLEPHRLGTTIQCIRCAFRFAYESG